MTVQNLIDILNDCDPDKELDEIVLVVEYAEIVTIEFE
jgi:hypothetical protein